MGKRATVLNSSKAVDPETGEILIVETITRRHDEIVAVFEAKPKNEVAHKREQHKREQKHIKLRTARDQKRIYKTLTTEQKAFIFSLLPYMDWETNLLIGDGEDGENGKPLRWCHVEKIAGISKNHRIKLMRELEEKRIIGYMMVQGKKLGIVINPEYALRGRSPQEALLAVFSSRIEVEE